MLEIRRGTAARSYENTFFREFAKNLAIFFEKYSINGLLIANSVCEVSPHLQIDSLLITENAICLIDLKNFGGNIALPDEDDFSEGKWVNQEGESIKGGSYINPYKQLSHQKKAFIWAFHNSSIRSSIISNKEKLNPSHVKKIVCFQKPTKLNGEIPGKDEIDFFITDSERYLETIKDILDVKDEEIKLSKRSFDAFNQIFIAEDFSTTEQYNKLEKIESTLGKLDFEGLYLDQISALQEITTFIQSNTDKIFILQGTSLSGKSHLLPFIKTIGFKNKVPQIEFFASSNRVSLNLLSNTNMEFNSIYSYIYGGGLQDDENSDEDNKDDDIDNIKLEVVPLKKNEDDNGAIYIVDEAQLVSDNHHQSLDLRFGSGKLLEDFIKFSDFEHSNRKIIFIGDGFQTSLGKKGESALNPSYFNEKYKLTTKFFQLIDKDNKSLIIKQALISVNGIRNNTYNQLSFQISDNIKAIKKNCIQSSVKQKIDGNSDFHILSYSNADAKKINSWIKKSILNNGEDLAEKDLIIINNNFKANTNDPFSELKIFNGQFGTITNADKTIISKVVTPKGKKPIAINFRYVKMAIKNTRHNVNFLSLENYRLSEKGELSDDEIIAFKIILNKEIKKQEEKKPFAGSESESHMLHSKEHGNLLEEVSKLEGRLKNNEKVKTELKEKEGKLRKLIKSAERKHRKIIEKELLNDASSTYYKYKNSAHLKFGWALTVHKSMSYKWDEVMFNVDQGEKRGKTNEAYFKWVYTGLTRAKNKVELINYEPITPLRNIEFKDANTSDKADKKIYFVANKDTPIDLLSDSVIKQFGFTDDKLPSILLQLYQLVNNKLEHVGIHIKSISHSNYQEVYELQGNNKQMAKVLFYYDNKHHVKIPTLIKAEPKQFGIDVIETLTSGSEIIEFDFISDDWRKMMYENIYQSLKNGGYQIAYIIPTQYKDTIKVVKNDSSLIVDMNYDGDGFFTRIICTYRNGENIWNDFKDILEFLRG